MRHAKDFFDWSKSFGIPIHQITPALIGSYLDGLPVALPSKKQCIAALRHFFDNLVVRHVIPLNPAHSIRTERYEVVEGKTPEIGVRQARMLLSGIDTSTPIGLRDKAIISILIYSAARVGAIAKLRVSDFIGSNDQYFFRFVDKGGKDREIPVRFDLQFLMLEYLQVRNGSLGFEPTSPLFTAIGRDRKQFSRTPLQTGDIRRMLKRRLSFANLDVRISPHSFRVTTITDLLAQGVPLEDVQNLAGHSDPRTTRLYDRRKRQVNRNIVERISV